MIAAVAAIAALALTVASGLDDPADPGDAAPVELVYPAAPALDAEPDLAPRVVEDPLARCKQMLLDSEPGADTSRLGSAERCLRQRALDAGADTARDDEVIARALALADAVGAWRLASQGALAAPTGHAARGKPVSLGGLVDSGFAEGLVHGALAGAGGGFLLAGAIFSATRASEQDTLPWLLASPALGAVAGTAGAWALLDVSAAGSGDIALATSTMWAGAAEGVLLQLAVFDGNLEASSVPLRFVTVLGGGAMGLAAGAALGPLLDVTPGDAAVANSALLWGGVMTGFGLAFVASNGASPSFAQGVLVLAAGTTMPYVATLVAHPLLKIERWPSWLIEAGGAAGFLTAGGALVVLSAGGGIGSQASIAFLGAGTLAGVGVGTAAAWAVSSALEPSGSIVPNVPAVSFAPALFSEPAPARHASRSGAMPGLVVGGRF